MTTGRQIAHTISAISDFYVAEQQPEYVGACEETWMGMETLRSLQSRSDETISVP